MVSRLPHALLVLALALPATLHAGDYTYQQTTQITGGSILKMMKTVGLFSSQARHIGDPVVSTIYLKDNRLANVSSDTIEIIDLDKETITQIDVQKKTYYVTTFAQMKAAMENAAAQMQQQAAQPPAPANPPAANPSADNPDAQNLQMSFDVKVRNTGVQKEISGLQSSESILTLVLKATDTQTQQSGNMAVTNDMWMVPAIPGYDQVRDFYKRFAEKMSDATIGLGFDFSKLLAQNPGAGQALNDMAGEMQKLQGVPIMQVMRMGMTVNDQPLPAASEAPLPPDPGTPSAGQVAKAGLTSAISSRLGGFGLGKKKPPPADPNADANNGQAQSTSAILMETQMTTSSFSSDPVDPSHFEIPADCQQVSLPAPTASAPASGGGTTQPQGDRR
ncbi:MAG TPA: hypothetical protein VHZ09_01870 [Acidobacteriaceae bacterium]|jgi:hypothetical protein|nr:hypothetical protein [Acidobacteriaceae bacterium]